MLAIIVKRSSPSLSNVFILSFINNTPTPNDFNSRVYWSVSTVFLANLETSFVIIRSIFPHLASLIIQLNSLRFFVLVPLIPSSGYILTNSHSGFFLIYSSKYAFWLSREFFWSSLSVDTLQYAAVFNIFIITLYFSDTFV